MLSVWSLRKEMAATVFIALSVLGLVPSRLNRNRAGVNGTKHEFTLAWA
jgi:hypothetical protein